MKDKIDSFSKGNFRYEKPELIISVREVSISVETGKKYSGTFSVSAGDKKRVKGLVYSSEALLSIKDNSFFGAENIIEYTFDAGYLDVGTKIGCKLNIVSDCGEAEIDFHVNVTAPSCSMGDETISDMFHYANLAKSNWSDAKLLFKSADFDKMIKYHDPECANLYGRLALAGNTSLAMEEFLIAVHKKHPIRFTTDKTELVYEAGAYSFMDKITIRKDTWGYAQLRIEADGDFIIPDRKLIWAEDFDGNSYELKLTFDPEKMRAGRNFGRLIISTVSGQLKINIVCRKNGERKGALSQRLRIKQCELALLNNYIAYRSGKINAGKYVAEAEDILNTRRVLCDESTAIGIYRVHLLLTAGKKSQAGTALDIIKEDGEWREAATEIYTAILYLESVMTSDNFRIQEYASELKTIYEQEKSFSSLYFSILADRRGRISRGQKFEAFRKVFTAGVNSPLLLLEALMLANEEPAVIKEFDGFTLQMLGYGLKNGLVGRNTALQAAYTAVRQKQGSKRAVNILTRLFETYKLNEILEALCYTLILCESCDKEACRWLCAGIEEQLRLNGLYEQCIKAAGNDYDAPLPKALFSYYLSGYRYDDEQAMALYRNILRFKTREDSIYISYLPFMREFARRLLGRRVVSSDAAALYNELLDVNELSSDEAAVLPDIIYKHEIRTDWKGAVSVCVSYRELENESIVPVNDGVAYVDLFSDNYELFLCDESGNKFCKSFEYTKKRLIERNELIACGEEHTDDIRVLLGVLEKARFEKEYDDLVELMRRTVNHPGLSSAFRIECEKSLIEYYYNNLEGDLMESHLVKLDLSALSCKERGQMIEYMILRELYNLAIRNIELFGFYGIDSKRLMKMAVRLLATDSEAVKGRTFSCICYYVFGKRKYNDTLLKYLVKEYNGATDNMYGIWKAAREFQLDTADIEERLLAQHLFCESDMKYADEVFAHYYSHGCMGKLIRAYLSYNAYGYLVFDRVPENEILEIMRREAIYDENDVCMLALLKSYTYRNSFSEADKSFIEYRIQKLEQKGLVLPFFKHFAGMVAIPEEMRDRHYVEYHTDPHKRVRIHFCLADSGGEEAYRIEDMKNVCYGIFVKEFTLFYGETLQYYISEEDDDNCIITESSSISPEPEITGDEDTRYHQLNLIITACEMKDEKTAMKLAESYIRNCYEAEMLIKPLKA